MRVGYVLIVGSLVLAWPAAASEPAGTAATTPEQQPKPKRFGINPDVVVQPVEPAPEQLQSPKPGLDTSTVVRVDEPAAQTGPSDGRICNGCWGTGYWVKNPRFDSVLIIDGDTCPFDDFVDDRTREIIEPASKGQGFYLPLQSLNSYLFGRGVTLQNPAKLTELGYPMSFEGPVTVRVGPNKYSVAHGEFTGYLQPDGKTFSVRFEVRNMTINSMNCSVHGRVSGRIVY